jgi:hypothetical protein
LKPVKKLRFCDFFLRLHCTAEAIKRLYRSKTLLFEAMKRLCCLKTLFRSDEAIVLLENPFLEAMKRLCRYKTLLFEAMKRFCCHLKLNFEAMKRLCHFKTII